MRYEILATKNLLYWYKNEKCHRDYGPSITNRYRVWAKKGRLHREDGPAVEYEDGRKEWWLNDEEYSEEEFFQISPIFPPYRV